eukprot:TRINITY_DN13855_c0_g1_i3.p1 TRINITY_DN13855_c0_g1~~TRINITY_DN13855_c0_g1_i3.p1  ORF type:complete len:256 (+),score=58.64 TRINITY_DN13855_c0_g1_i3:168-935(+)
MCIRDRSTQSTGESKTMGCDGKESGFKGRDDQGLMLASAMPRACSEQQERVHYFKLYATITTNLAPLTALSLYWAVRYCSPTQYAAQQIKLEFIYAHNLSWVFACWYVVFLTRLYLAINANGARAPARLDRPDQHVYKIMARSGELSSAPCVLMDNTGAAGRFNRAQRAAANMDESIAVYLSGLLLVAAVFGPVALLLAGANAFGRVKFAHAYKADHRQRLAGFTPSMLSEQVSASLVGLVAVKGVLGTVWPWLL